MTIRNVLTHYFLLKDGYTGALSIKTGAPIAGCETYAVKTDGNDFDVVRYIDDPEPRQFFYREVGTIGGWISSSGEAAVEIQGKPYISPITTGPQYFKSFAEILTDYRYETNLTVPALATMLHVPQRTAESWLAGERLPTATTEFFVYKTLNIIE